MDSMTLHADGREYAHWTVDGVTQGTPVALATDGGGTWTTAEWTDATTVRVLLAGPDASPDSAHVLAERRSYSALLRFTTASEVIVRDAGRITVKN